MCRCRREDVADGVVAGRSRHAAAPLRRRQPARPGHRETTGFLAAPQFARMKHGAYFINTARGPLVDYDALYQALASAACARRHAGDLRQEPPPPGWPLLQLDNVTLTPHIAGASTTTVRIAAAMVAEEVRRYLAGEPPLNPC